MFTKVKKHKQISIPVTILFADLRGYTDLSQQIETPEINQMLHLFYDQCSSAIWEREGIINKFIGDAVLAIFNFPLVRKDHVLNAVEAAIQLQRSCRDIKIEIGLEDERNPRVGIGIHTGECFMGEVGTAYKDFTAIGPVVNLASRLQGAASAGEILVTAEVYNCVRNKFAGATKTMFDLKGINHLVEAYTIDY
jgi:adenylate cyclase